MPDSNVVNPHKHSFKSRKLGRLPTYKIIKGEENPKNNIYNNQNTIGNTVLFFT